MIGVQTNKDRFSLYHLDEGELFIKDFASTTKFIHPTTKQATKQKGIIYLGSRSLVFVSDDNTQSTMKFNFTYFKTPPSIKLIQGEKEQLHFITRRIIEIPNPSSYTQNYKLHDYNSDIEIEFLFENIETVYKIVLQLFDMFNKKDTSSSFDSIDILKSLFTFKFDVTEIKSINERYEIKTELYVKQLLPLIEVPGMLMLTDKRIYFQPLFKLYSKRCFNVKYTAINQLFKRRVHLLETGIEIVTSKKQLLFEFEQEKIREIIYKVISQYIPENCETNFSIDKYCKLWVEGAMSNYEYLLKINNAANRTRNDMSQYPIFPWTLTNFTGDTINLKDEKNYRDLTKPIGALNPKRLEEFEIRYEEMFEPKYFYGTHYSTPAYVIGFLARKYPQYMLKLHSGKFDSPDRLFYSIEIDWSICYANCGSLKELIPEFFEENDDFLVNSKRIELGINSKNERVDNVLLPPWAQSADDFLRIMRDSLESDYVNNNIHHWIDLIFGYKQRGKEAIEAKNLFHPACYADGSGINQNDLMTLKLNQLQATEFGQVPKQLFFSPHPKKYSTHIKELFLKEGMLDIIKDQSLTTTTSSTLPSLESLNIESAYTLSIKLSNNHNNMKSIFNCEYQSLPKFHKKKITSSSILSESKLFISGSEDGTVKIFDYSNSKMKRMINVSHLAITSMVEVNNSTQIAIGGADNKISLMNALLGKVTSKFEGHEDSVVSLFYSTKINKLISSGDSTSKVWDISKTTKSPVNAFYDSDSTIVSSDYRQSDNLLICIDKGGHFVLRNLDAKNDTVKNNFGSENGQYYYIQFNTNNMYQYYICTSDSFKVYELRSNKVLESYDVLKKSYCLLDNSNYLIGNDEGMFLYGSDMYKDNFWDYGKVTHMKWKHGSDLIVIGNEAGDIYYSNC